MNTEMSNFMKIRSVGAELLHACRQTDRQTDGRTGMTKLLVAFRNVVNAPQCSIKLGIMRVCVLFIIILYALELSVCLMKHNGKKTRWRAEVQRLPLVCSGVHDTAVLSQRKEPGTRDRRIRTRDV